ncbi:MAG TPA: hypothetical protein VGV36_01765, partial [Solirubrobacteraceae bacterium]|nr:hypothetical protein [Solirubrobacteraceae bacterium]
MPAHADPLDPRRARVAPGVLRAFNDAGVLTAADVHVARRLAALGGETDDLVLLGAALAARAPRLGHVCVDLAGVRASAAVDREESVDLDALPWPQDVAGWMARLGASPLVSAGSEPGLAAARPLRLEGTLVYLDRYWTQERDVAADVVRRSDATADGVDDAVLAAGLERLFAGETGGR